MARRRAWMTSTGGVLASIGGTLLGAAQVAPVEEWKPWLTFAGFLAGSVGAALMGTGIRRRLPRGEG